MQTVLLHSESTTDLHLLTELAKKIGITVKYLSEDENENFELLKAMNKGRTTEYVDTASFLDNLRK